MKRRPIIAAATLLGPLAGLAALSTPASASCVEASVWIVRYDSPPQYALDRHCVVPTPFGPAASVGDEVEYYDPGTVQPGDVVGIGFRVTVPGP
jgi:hypothetical protein